MTHEQYTTIRILFDRILEERDRDQLWQLVEELDFWLGRFFPERVPGQDPHATYLA